jgi:hypothetical protein
MALKREPKSLNDFCVRYLATVDHYRTIGGSWEDFKALGAKYGGASFECTRQSHRKEKAFWAERLEAWLEEAEKVRQKFTIHGSGRSIQLINIRFQALLEVSKEEIPHLLTKPLHADAANGARTALFDFLRRRAYEEKYPKANKLKEYIFRAYDPRVVKGYW